MNPKFSHFQCILYDFGSQVDITPQVIGKSSCIRFLCQLTFQSTNIMVLYSIPFYTSLALTLPRLCGVSVDNFSSKSTRLRDMLLHLKDILSVKDDKS